MDDNKEKEMSRRVKIEVGQVWQEKKSSNTKTILATFKNNDDNYVAYLYESGAGKHGGSCGYVAIWDYCKLITNADGTPHVKPNDYRDGDVWVFCGQSGKSMGDSYLIKTVHGVKMVSSRDLFKPISDTAFPQLPHEYKLIYRIGQGVINE